MTALTGVLLWLSLAMAHPGLPEDPWAGDTCAETDEGCPGDLPYPEPVPDEESRITTVIGVRG